MSLRFFIDQCVPFDVTAALRAWQHEALELRDHLPIRSPDTDVIAKAQELNCMLLSMNGDFSDISAYPPAQFGGIIAIQLGNHPELIAPLLQRLANFLREHRDREFYRGRLFIVEAHRIRVR